MIRTTARQQGGAVIVTIPADILKLRGIKAGDPLGIDVTPNGFNVKKVGIPETNRADPGPVVCEPLGIRFPTLYRGVVTSTLEDFQAYGIDDDPDVTLGEWIHYDLKKTCVIGTASWEPVNHIFREDQEDSIIIRYHPNIESAMGYCEAALDFLDMDDESIAGQMIFQTEDGIFTFAKVPTKAAWPGPLVIYLALIPSTRLEGQKDDWVAAFGPDGEMVELPEHVAPKSSV